jgi:hypothetical protein
MSDIHACVADHKFNHVAELLPWNWQARQNVRYLKHEPTGHFGRSPYGVRGPPDDYT